MVSLKGEVNISSSVFFVCACAGTYIMVSICKSFVRRLYDGEILCGVVVTEILIHVIRFINAEVGKVRLLECVRGRSCVTSQAQSTSKI